MVRRECLQPRGLSVTDGARALGVTRQALNNLLNQKSGVSPEMAIRLEKAFGGAAVTWLERQLAFDLDQARQHENEIQVEVLPVNLSEPAQARLF